MADDFIFDEDVMMTILVGSEDDADPNAAENLLQLMSQCALDTLGGAESGAWAGAGIGGTIGTLSPDPFTTAGGAAVGAGAGAIIGGTIGYIASDACWGMGADDGLFF